jgi:hypothetical protein
MVLPTEGQAHLSLAPCHARLGHQNVQMVREMSRHSMVKGLGDIHKEKRNMTVMHVVQLNSRELLTTLQQA